MTSSIYITIKIGQFLLIGMGIFANTFLLLLHILMLLLDHRPKPSDMIVCHVAFVHIMKLFTALFLLSTDLFEALNFMNDFKCKSLFCMIRVTRGLSMSTTCLLSILQAIIISPINSWLARFKHKCTKYIFHSFIILWFLSFFLNSNCLLYTAASFNVTQSNLLNVSKYCSLSRISSITRGLFFTFSLSRDVFFIGAMLLSSAYMVILLSRHQRQCQHLHRTHFSSRVSPERRATQTVLLLVTFFVVIYWVDVIISFSSSLLWTYDPVILDVQKLVSNVYATVSGLVLISSDKRIKMCFRNVGKLQSNYNCLFMK
ncbi:putative vomeronasal receptor-like protein 4 [Hyaena hyaena]|uniref:putative vomeronasal receptor-like protein 4 n=1 Tax=Hyaena hyaena TaxID=95912 RepID=UPI0019222C4D|nr:putative vomeronasal receptor-like protein 4 [Hyaena hyaena]